MDTAVEQSKIKWNIFKIRNGEKNKSNMEREENKNVYHYEIPKFKKNNLNL